MHACRVVIDEERFARLLGVVAVHEVDDLGGDLLIYGCRPFKRQRPLITTALVPLRAVRGRARDDRARRREAGYRARGINCTWGIWKTLDRGICTRCRERLLCRGLLDVGEAHLLHRVQVIEITPKFLEAVRGRQGEALVAQVVLTKLARAIAEIKEELADRGGSRHQPRWASGYLRYDQTGTHRIHAGNESVAPRRAALHGVVVEEPRALVADSVDVGCFTGHQALMVYARLHPADVVPHDEDDVGLLLCLLRECG